LDGSTNVERFMALHGIADFDSLLARSVAEPAWFWDEVVRFLDIPFAGAYEHVLDDSDGVPWTQWFLGGTLNLAGVCVDRWADDPETCDREAVVWEGEDGRTVTWTYAELRRHVDALAYALSAAGIGEGDAVGIFLPMIPEVVAACMAVAKLGAIFLPIFSGYGPDAIAVRLEDASS